MSEPTPDCTAPASRIVFRGKKRLLLCARCALATYTGKGTIATYVIGDPTDEATRVPGVFRGPARACGEEISA